MRRRWMGTVAGVVLSLAVIGPVAAADRVVESGRFDQLSLGMTSCSGNTCHDAFVDAFPIGDGLVLVCYFEGTFNARTGRVTDEASGCTETSDSVVTVTDDLDASLANTEIQLFSCNQRRCTEVEVVTVSASGSAAGPVTTSSGRVTVNEGACRSRITFTDHFADIAGTITVDGSTIDAVGFAAVTDQTVATICR